MTLTNAYATLPEFQSEFRGVTVQPSNQAALERALNAASRQIDRATGWYRHGFWQDSAVTVRTYDVESQYCLDVPEGISTSTGLIVKVDYDFNGTFETTLTLDTDFSLMPRDADDDGWPWTELRIITTGSAYFPWSTYNRPGVQVTAKFGWASVPDDVKQATLIQAMQLYKSPDAAFGAVALGDTGAAMRIQAGLHPTVRALVAPFTRPSVG